MKGILLLFCIFFSVNVLAQEAAFDFVRNNQFESLQKLVFQQKEVVNQLNKDGFSLLILASYKGNLEMVDFLLKNDADVNNVSEMGTAIMAAVVKNKIEIVELLIQYGADVNLTDQAQTSAIHLAVQFTNIPMTQLLLNHHADKTKLDDKGKTAFEYAVFSGNNELINLLR